jgi:hypothetical protein
MLCFPHETQFTTVNAVTLYKPLEMPRLTVELKLKVIRLHCEEFRVCDILENLKEENSF